MAKNSPAVVTSLFMNVKGNMCTAVNGFYTRLFACIRRRIFLSRMRKTIPLLQTPANLRKNWKLKTLFCIIRRIKIWATENHCIMMRAKNISAETCIFQMTLRCLRFNKGLITKYILQLLFQWKEECKVKNKHITEILAPIMTSVLIFGTMIIVCGCFLNSDFAFAEYTYCLFMSIFYFPLFYWLFWFWNKCIKCFNNHSDFSNVFCLSIFSLECVHETQ